MKYLGVDYGTKRIGLAISDEDGRFAFPHSVLIHKSHKEDSGAIIDLCHKEKIDQIVCGHSRNYEGKDNPIMQDINGFVSQLKKYGIEVVFQDETLTSSEAERIQGKIKLLDASAAAIMLNHYLEQLRFRDRKS